MRYGPERFGSVSPKAAQPRSIKARSGFIMKNFPFKILFICIFMPPICYVITLQLLETYLHNLEASKLEKIIIQDYDALYEGRYTVKDEINRNMQEYLGNRFKYNVGIRTQILIKTKNDRILYPTLYQMELDSTQSPTTSNYMEVAEENYSLINEGIIITLDLKIKHNSWLSNSILVFYVFIFVFILRTFVKKNIREAEKFEAGQNQLIYDLSGQLENAENKLKEVIIKENDYLKNIEELKKDKQSLSTDIDGLLDEMEELEKGLKDQKDLKEKTEFEVLELKEELDRLKVKQKIPKKKKKMIENIGKRFRILYKNITFSNRALEGFLSLTEEFQLKAEEVIHRLNEDDSQVSVKRNVFGKGGKMSILEVDFSYSGRLYFQKDSQAKIQVIAIGTKKTQDKDLSYLESVKQ